GVAAAPAGWSADVLNNIGVNISEPLPAAPNYYSKVSKASYKPNKKPNKAHVDPDDKIADAYGDSDDANKYPDDPFDWSNPLFNPALRNKDPKFSTFPLFSQRLWVEETQWYFRTVYLQRLADPTRPFDLIQNPYFTVDWMSMNLTVYN